MYPWPFQTTGGKQAGLSIIYEVCTGYVCMYVPTGHGWFQAHLVKMTYFAPGLLDLQGTGL